MTQLMGEVPYQHTIAAARLSPPSMKAATVMTQLSSPHMLAWSFMKTALVTMTLLSSSQVQQEDTLSASSEDPEHVQ